MIANGDDAVTVAMEIGDFVKAARANMEVTLQRELASLHLQERRNQAELESLREQVASFESLLESGSTEGDAGKLKAQVLVDKLHERSVAFL